jgi:hypothetical protein
MVIYHNQSTLGLNLYLTLACAKPQELQTQPCQHQELLKGQELSFSAAVPTLRLSGCEALRMIDSSVVAGFG